MKEFSQKEVYKLVFVIIVSIAFMETSSPIWTLNFLREFLLNLLIYGAIAAFAVIALSKWIEDKKHKI
ncbi:MAG: hypothetical protein ABIH87_03720 [bacterium]